MFHFIMQQAVAHAYIHILKNTCATVATVTIYYQARAGQGKGSFKFRLEIQASYLTTCQTGNSTRTHVGV